jgi:xylulokinase
LQSLLVKDITIGIDLGTSSVKAVAYSVLTGKVLAKATYPQTEAPIITEKVGWAEQNPADWWRYTQQAIALLLQSNSEIAQKVVSIGIAYQMHGLVCLDKNGAVLRNAIIWCDSRAVEIGETAFNEIGNETCLSEVLNSPANFTAAKLAWVKANEPEIYQQIATVLLPGDYISYKLTGNLNTTVAGLSEGVFWDFKNKAISNTILNYFGFSPNLLPTVSPSFFNHGMLQNLVAVELGLPQGTTVSYKAGDQPNNALSLQVLHPNEVAATAGTSGVIYAVTNTNFADTHQRVNTFAHVNYTATHNSLGVLCCINGCGIMYKYIQQTMAPNLSYSQLNELASTIQVGSDGLIILPFANGAERILNNKIINGAFKGVQANVHTVAHYARAVQEGIAFAMSYGLEIMFTTKKPTIIRAGFANLFLSEVFTEAFVNTTGVSVALYNNDGSVGASIGAAIGANLVHNSDQAFANFTPLKTINPNTLLQQQYAIAYNNFKNELQKEINN